MLAPCQVTLEIYFIGLVAFAPSTGDQGFVAVLPDVQTRAYYYSGDGTPIPTHYPFFAYKSHKEYPEPYDLDELIRRLEIEPETLSLHWLGALILDDEEIEINGSQSAFPKGPSNDELPENSNKSDFEWVPRMEDLVGTVNLAKMDPDIMGGSDAKDLIKGRFRSNQATSLSTAGLVTRKLKSGPKLDSYQVGVRRQAMTDLAKFQVDVTGETETSFCRINLDVKDFANAITRSITLHALINQPLELVFGNIPSTKIFNGTYDYDVVHHFQVYYELLKTRPPLHQRQVPIRSRIRLRDAFMEPAPDIIKNLLKLPENRVAELKELLGRDVDRHPWDILACPGARFEGN